MLGKSAAVDSACVAVRWSRSSSVYVSVLFALLGIATADAADVLTQHYNNGRTGATLAESILNTTSVASGEFQKLWTLYADGQVVAQPLYVSDLQIDTTTNPNAPSVKGKFNAVIIATMHNTIYVYDADKENRGADGQTIPLWATWLVLCFRNNRPMVSGCTVDFITPGVDDRLAVDVVDEGHQAVLEFVFGADADMAQ